MAEKITTNRSYKSVCTERAIFGNSADTIQLSYVVIPDKADGQE